MPKFTAIRKTITEMVASNSWKTQPEDYQFAALHWHDILITLAAITLEKRHSGMPSNKQISDAIDPVHLNEIVEHLRAADNMHDGNTILFVPTLIVDDLFIRLEHDGQTISTNTDAASTTDDMELIHYGCIRSMAA